MLVLAPEVVHHIISFWLFPFIPPTHTLPLFSLHFLMSLMCGPSPGIMKVRLEPVFSVVKVLLFRHLCWILNEHWNSRGNIHPRSTRPGGFSDTQNVVTQDPLLPVVPKGELLDGAPSNSPVSLPIQRSPFGSEMADGKDCRTSGNYLAFPLGCSCTSDEQHELHMCSKLCVRH